MTSFRTVPRSGTNPQLVNIWLPVDSVRQLYAQFPDSVQAWVAEANLHSVADFQLLDWRTRPSRDNLLFDTIDKKLEKQGNAAQLPALIVVDQSTDISTAFDPAVDISTCEFINACELNTGILELRIRKLLLLTEEKLNLRLVKDNAEVILDEVMRQSNDWLIVKSLDHRFLHASGKFCRAHSKSVEEIVGRNDLQLGTSPEVVYGIPGSEWKGFWALDREVTDSGIPLVSPPLLQDAESGLYERMEKVPLRNKNGNIFALLVCVFRFIETGEDSQSAKTNDDGRSTHLWDRKSGLPNNPALFAMVTERKKAEELKHESDRAFIAQNRFIATASHDLRQPLHALGLYVDALESFVNADGQEIVKSINDNVGALNKLLSSLLDISRLDANVDSAKLSDFNVGELLEFLQNEYLNMAGGKSLEITCRSDGSFVYSDQVLLGRVIRNLLINSIDNTVQGKISLSARQFGNRVEVVIADTGIGIPIEKQELVFEEFVKIETSSQQAQQGLGLGLSIVKRLCILLDIGMRLESEVGAGTVVVLTVPLGSRDSLQINNTKDVAAESERPDHSGTTEMTARYTILVIDDNIEVCRGMETLLMQSGHQVVSATNPDDALLNLQKASIVPDAMLVDFRLSDEMTGLDAIDIFKSELGKSLPALIITGDTTDDGLKQIVGSGYPYLHKPVESGELLEKLQNIMNS